jgi:tryptophan-rich sensory protein
MIKNKIIKRLNRDFRKIDWKLLAVCMFLSFFVAYIGSGFTVIDSWYESVKPSITPPNFVFPIVWTILFFLIGVSFYYSWKFCDKHERDKIAWLFSINFVLNISWSFFFFKLHNTLFALIVIVLLILSIISLILVNWKKTRIASYLLIPYLVWVCFATILNILIVVNTLQ